MFILVFIVILSVLVIIHELGHYLVAKYFKIRVEEFGFGFPPKVWGRKKGETEYTINALPFGGFVKLYGEDEAGAGRVKVGGEVKDESTIKDKDRAYFARPAWQRALVVVAGVVMNAFLAFAIYYIYLGVSGFKAEIPLYTPYNFAGANTTVRQEVIIGEVVKGSPAEKSGIKDISKVRTINGEKIDTSEEFIEIINANKGKEILLEWQEIQTGAQKKARITPLANPPKDRGALGVSLVTVDVAILSYDTPMQKVTSGVVHTVNLGMYNMIVLGDLISYSFEKKTAAPLGETVASPVGLAAIVNDLLQIPDAKERFLQVLNLAGLLSISLAIFNILPIPALDGGRFFFIVVELLTGKKVPVKFENVAHTVGFVLLLSLLILITFRDIFRYL